MFQHRGLQACALHLRHWLTFRICLRFVSKAMDLTIVMEIQQMEGEGEQFPHFNTGLSTCIVLCSLKTHCKTHSLKTPVPQNDLTATEILQLTQIVLSLATITRRTRFWNSHNSWRVIYTLSSACVPVRSELRPCQISEFKNIRMLGEKLILRPKRGRQDVKEVEGKPEVMGVFKKSRCSRAEIIRNNHLISG